jgi:hypothetical protein
MARRLAASVAAIAALVCVPATAGSSSGGRVGAITTVVGGDQAAGPMQDEDGGPARKAHTEPFALAVDARGSLYLAEPTTVRKVSPDGVISTFAGCWMEQDGASGFAGSCGDVDPTGAELNDVPATRTSVTARALAPGPNGSIYIADVMGLRVVDSAGIIHAVSAPAVCAPISTLDYPVDGLAVDRSGDVFYADACHVRELTPDGITRTIAGNEGVDDVGPVASGVPATTVQVNPRALAVDDRGNVFEADARNVIRKIDPSGVITTIAGSSDGVPVVYEGLWTGDDQPALGTTLSVPNSLAVDRIGDVYFGDEGGIRMIDTHGLLHTAAGVIRGSGENQSDVIDGGPATRALLQDNMGIALDGHGDLYVAESDRVRMVVLGAPHPPTAHGLLVDWANAVERDLGWELRPDRLYVDRAARSAGLCLQSPYAARRRVAQLDLRRRRLLQAAIRQAAPDAHASAKALLVSAVQREVAVDAALVGWLHFLQTHRRGGWIEGYPQHHCTTTEHPAYARLLRAQARARSAMTAFLASFDPLARGLHLAVLRGDY